MLLLSGLHSAQPQQLPADLAAVLHTPPGESQCSTPKLNWIVQRVVPEREASLVKWCMISWHQLSDGMADSTRSLDIVKVATALMAATATAAAQHA